MSLTEISVPDVNQSCNVVQGTVAERHETIRREEAGPVPSDDKSCLFKEKKEEMTKYAGELAQCTLKNYIGRQF
jgi:hypothetical protein